MPTPEDTSQAPHHDPATGGWRAFWKKYRAWVGTVLTTAVVIPLATWGVVSFEHWISKSPEQYLSLDVTIPKPSEFCNGGTGWVFDKDPQQLPPPPINDDFDDWARANGGIPATGNYIEVHLHALQGHKVTVPSDGIKVQRKSNADPPNGTYYPAVSGGCGGLLPYGFSLNLDTHPISVTAKPDEGVLVGLPGGVPRLVELPHEITSDQTEVWDLYALTQTCTCEWTATLEWIADDGTGKHTSEITDDGHPFRVAATTRANTTVSPDLHGGWVTVQK